MCQQLSTVNNNFQIMYTSTLYDWKHRDDPLMDLGNTIGSNTRIYRDDDQTHFSVAVPIFVDGSTINFGMSEIPVTQNVCYELILSKCSGKKGSNGISAIFLSNTMNVWRHFNSRHKDGVVAPTAVDDALKQSLTP
jgi:hypothetical protein